MQLAATNTGMWGGLAPVTQSNSLTVSARPGMYEYLLVANPGNEINAQLIAEKESFYERYHEKIAVKTKPHITIANFMAMEQMEDTIFRWMQRICSMQESFDVTLNNFSGLPPHTIFLRVQHPQPFIQLANQLRVIDNYVQEYGMPAAKLVKTPHLTIARSLPEDVYTKAMFDYSRRDFFGTFKVSELILLKRRHQFDSCEKINVFRLAEPSTLF
jgi:2'-5' RNA ligase